MIKLKIDTDGYDLSDDLKSRIENRIGGLDEFMDNLIDGHVTVSWEGGRNEETMVRAEVWGGGHKFQGSDTDWRARNAIDQTPEKLSAQIRREHSKDLRSDDCHRDQFDLRCRPSSRALRRRSPAPFIGMIWMRLQICRWEVVDDLHAAGQ